MTARLSSHCWGDFQPPCGAGISDDPSKLQNAIGSAGEPVRQKVPRTTVKRLDLPGGVLDEEILASCEAIAQQTNCIGCHPACLAEGVAKALPYGCSYADRRPEPPASRFAISADRGRPGTIDVRRPASGSKNSPTVINMFAQWELGPALKYNRVPCPAEYGSDSRGNREAWFQQCLDNVRECPS